MYEAASRSDGRRYLVDRLWPQAFPKDYLGPTDRLQDAAPSPELRAWFGHDPAKFPVFRTRYRAELKEKPGFIGRLVEEARAGTVTLLFAARDTEHCNAEILREVIEQNLRNGREVPPP